MYQFYEHYRFGGGSSTRRTKTHITQMITVYVNPPARLIEQMQNQYGRICKYNKNSKKLYIRQRVRLAKVSWHKSKLDDDYVLDYCFSENYILGINAGDCPYKDYRND